SSAGIACELKSQYGHLRTHQGTCTYTDKGGRLVSVAPGGTTVRAVALEPAGRIGMVVATTYLCGDASLSSNWTSPRARWLTRFFSAGSSSAAVRPSSGSRKCGS